MNDVTLFPLLLAFDQLDSLPERGFGMFIALVYWIVTEGSEDEFVQTWKKLTCSDKSGLVGEYLSKVELPDGLNTWDLSHEGASTFVNVGIWRTKEDFVEQIGKYTATRRGFEKKFRARATLTPFIKRIGKVDLESASRDVETVP